MRGWVIARSGALEIGGTSCTRKSGEPSEVTWLTAETTTPKPCV